MQKQCCLLMVVIITCLCNNSYAQLVGNSTFLQGRFLEIGVARNGAFHAANPPAGPLGPYHPNGPGAFLGHVYDWGHDGWAAGTPPYYGDYTYPGTPFEGWAMQAGPVVRCDAFYNTGGGAGTNFTGGLTGTNVSYSNVGGKAIGVWQGTCNGLNVRQSTRVDLGASWAVITTVFVNPTAAPIAGVYYWRTSDPDNAQTVTTSFGTDNTINYQNDPIHRVMVSSIGTDASGITYPNAYMALCTKDCRAKAMIYSDWSPTPTSGAANTLDRIWAQTSTLGSGFFGIPGVQTYTLGQTVTYQDYAFGLIFNIGTIAAGDSAVISYAYTYNNNSGIDSAFPEPALIVNGVYQPPAGPAPAPTIDTFNSCGTGFTTLPVHIDSASDKIWTNSTWSWSPTTGLSSPTGVDQSITLSSLPPVITYTITGTSSGSCNQRVMYLTVKTCNGATVNSPCLGDSLIFNAPGDSTAATYQWYGPAPSTTVINTNQKFFKYPSTWADTGTYHVIKTVAGVADTATITVVIQPKPVATASSNSPLCIGAIDTLELLATSSVTPVTYSWSGPGTFSSALQNPTKPNFAMADTGIYSVIVTTSNGCKDTATARTVMLSPPGPPVVTTDTSYCKGELVQPFTITATGTVSWFPSAAGTGGAAVTPLVSTAAVGTFTYYFNQAIGQCVSPIDSITIIVHPAPVADFTALVYFGCSGDLVTVQDRSQDADTYLWNFGGGITATTMNASHTYPRDNDGGIFTILLTVHNLDGCADTQTVQADTRHKVTAAFTPSRDTCCAINPADQVTMTNTSAAQVTGLPVPVGDLKYAWDFANGNTDTTLTGGVAQGYPVAGTYELALVVTDTIGCKDTAYGYVTSLEVKIKAFDDTTLCLKKPLLMENKVSVYPPVPSASWVYSWTESEPNLSDLNIHHPYLTGTGTFIDVLTATIEPSKWGCSATKTMTVNSISGRVLTNVTPDATIPYGSTLQLNSDNEIYYTWEPNDGSINNPNINNPVVAPRQTTIYTVYGMDEYGCLDTAFVTVTVDSTLNEAIPSAFTPNGDGLNDVFRLIGLKYQRLVEFRIYNRWGQQIFYTANANDGWDGTFEGAPQDLGVYHYQVIVAHPDGANVRYKGDVTLIR